MSCALEETAAAPPSCGISSTRLWSGSGIAMAGVAVSAVARGFAELSDVARKIAAELDAGDVATRLKAG